MMVAEPDGGVSYPEMNGLPPLFKDKDLNLNPFYLSKQFMLQATAVQASSLIGPDSYKHCLELSS